MAVKLIWTGGRMEARFCGVAAADRVRCEGSVRESTAAATCAIKKTTTLNVKVGSRDALPHKKKDCGVVAEARLQEIAPSKRSLFARRKWIVQWPWLYRK